MTVTISSSTPPVSLRPAHCGVYVQGDLVIATGSLDLVVLPRLRDALDAAGRAAAAEGVSITLDLTKATHLDGCVATLLRGYTQAGLRVLCRQRLEPALAGLSEHPRAWVRAIA